MSNEQGPNNTDTSNAHEQKRKRQARFLKAFRESGNIKHSCKVAGINRSTYYDWKATDALFQAELAEAEKEANDTLEYAAYERAVKGVESYVVSMGKIVYEEIPVLDADGNPKLDKRGNPIVKRGKAIKERKYSDSLLITLLKARMPEKYKERHEHTGKNGGPIEIKRTLHRLSDDELDLLEQLARKAAEEGSDGGSAA